MTQQSRPRFAAGAADEKTPTKELSPVILRDTAFERILALLDGVRRNGNSATARCPVHDDRTPSLAIYRKPGRVKVVCFGGCYDLDVLAAVGLRIPDLFDEPRTYDFTLRSPVRIELPAPKSRLQYQLDRLRAMPDLGERLCQRIHQQEMLEAGPAYWIRQAEAFEDAAPRRDDFTGQTGPEQLAEAVERCKLIAENCRRHAALITTAMPEPINAEVLDVLAEVA
jgi:hypothetical protein